MSGWIERLNDVSRIWLDAVGTVMVQSIFVFVVATVLCWLLGRFSAGLRFWIWQAAACKLLMVPFSLIVVVPVWPATSVTLPVEFNSIHAPSANSPLINHLPLLPGAMQSILPSTTTWLFACWVMICLLQLARCARRKHRLNTLLLTCDPASDRQRNRLTLLAVKMGLKQSVRLVRGDVLVPLVTGVRSPTIILPIELEFDQSAFDQIAMHELAHVKRRDLLWVWLPEVLRMFLFFHPVVYWIRQQSTLQSEMACDELVLAAGTSRRAYAETLLSFAAARSEVRERTAGLCR